MGGSGNMARESARQVAVIANGTALSSTINLHGHVLVALVTPAVWTAAAMTFQVPVYDPVSGAATWIDLYDDAGVEVTIASAAIPAAAARAFVNKAVLEQLAALHQFRIRSGVTATPVNQGAERQITVLTKG